MTKPQQDIHHPVFARIYAGASRQAELRGVADFRREILTGISGKVIEIGCGNGLNFGYYPDSVESVLAVEPEPHLRNLAKDAASKAKLPIEVVPGVADAIPSGDEVFDAAVASLVLCSVPNQQTALGELHRVMRPGGELRFFEHVHATTPILGPMLRFAQATFWPLIAGGCHPARDTKQAISASGFAIELIREFRFKESALMPSIPHIIGMARKPAGKFSS